jgi:hypothetical protein
LSLFRLCGARPAHAMREPHGPEAGQRGQPQSERRTGHLDLASPDPVLGSMKQVAAIRSLAPMTQCSLTCGHNPLPGFSA